MQVSSQLSASVNAPNTSPAMASIVAQQKGFLLGQLAILAHAADSILGNFTQDVPVLSDDAKVGVESTIENLFPAPARSWIAGVIGMGEAAVEGEEKQLDAEAVNAILVGKANLDAAAKAIGAY